MKIKAKVWQDGRPEEEHSQVLVDAEPGEAPHTTAMQSAMRFCREWRDDEGRGMGASWFPLRLMVRVEGKGPVRVLVRARFEPQFSAEIVDS